VSGDGFLTPLSSNSATIASREVTPCLLFLTGNAGAVIGLFSLEERRPINVGLSLTDLSSLDSNLFYLRSFSLLIRSRFEKLSAILDP